MIKTFLSIAFIFTGFLTYAQSFVATYNFAATTSVSGTTDPTPSPIITGITCGTFVSVGTSSTNISANRFSFSNWPVAALSGSTSASSYSAMGGVINLTKYYEVKISPINGYSVLLDSITFLTRRTDNGPRSYSVRCSADAYSNNLVAVVPTNTLLGTINNSEFYYNADVATNSNYNSGTKIVTNGSLFMGFTNPINFRFYAWNAELTTGTFGIDDVTFYGSVSFNTSVGKLSFDLNSSLKVYPVPSYDGIVFIECENISDVTKIELLDVLGNIIANPFLDNVKKLKLDLKDMPNGNYFVRIHSAKTISTQKIILGK